MTQGANEWYDCTGTWNCTGLELAALQWGKTGVTKYNGIGETALPADNPYTPVSTSVAYWGNWTVSGVTKPPEFHYYA